eukprot:TRINITY_DN2127_c0_g1_i20.p11 TRINITY_DN2127_c0_g1~~TRINITY_DN2127_c0_g1_i20.p11  ORF type:complete len:122 (+),score=0.12 TRINITY_DN2127_c0_g1_i20:725-1090(+)
MLFRKYIFPQNLFSKQPKLIVDWKDVYQLEQELNRRNYFIVHCLTNKMIYSRYITSIKTYYFGQVEKQSGKTKWKKQSKNHFFKQSDIQLIHNKYYKIINIEVKIIKKPRLRPPLLQYLPK